MKRELSFSSCLKLIMKVWVEAYLGDGELQKGSNQKVMPLFKNWRVNNVLFFNIKLF